ncbi:MAG: class I SAM-dependent methyltransferase [Crocinitomicaceae bacterium]|nr:class I SAM-dependent methyltransferase [Crocinitomicaceae bacterium]
MKKIFELILNFKTILKYGFARFDEDRYQKKCLQNFGKLQLPTIDLSDISTRNYEEIYPYSFLDGTSMLTDIFLLRTLAQQLPDCHYLEIGSWRGESLANVAQVAKSATSITLSAKEMNKLGFSEKFISNHGIFTKDLDNVSTYYENSHTFDFKKLEDKFDLIFVDGDHTHIGVFNDTKKVFNLRRDNNSFIVWHDYGYSAETVRYSVLHAILAAIPVEKHKNLYHVSHTACAIYCENILLDSHTTHFPSTPNKVFKVNMSFERFKI